MHYTVTAVVKGRSDTHMPALEEGIVFTRTGSMKTEKEKMLAGELYDALDPQLTEERLKARLLIKALNDSREDEAEGRARILKDLIPHAGPGLWLQPPFYCDYGTNISIGEKVFFN